MALTAKLELYPSVFHVNASIPERARCMYSSWCGHAGDDLHATSRTGRL